MSYHQISSLGSVSATGQDEIRVPIQPRSYRSCRNLSAFTAVFIGVLFVMLCYVGYSLLYKDFAIRPSAGWLGCLFFFLFYGTASGMMLWSLTHLVRRMSVVLNQNLPGLIINQDGIIDNASDNPTGLIQWEQIDKIMLTTSYSKSRKLDWPGIAFLLNERNRPKPGPMMLFFGCDLKLPIYQVFIRQEMIGKPASEVVKMANEFRARMTQ